MIHLSTKFSFISILSLILYLLGAIQYTYAQNTKSSLNACIQGAEREFRKGNLENTILTIEECLSTAEEPQESDLVNAHLLLTLAYLEDNQKNKAETNFERLLYWDPEFDISKLPSEDADLLSLLYQSYRTDPVIYIGGEMGGRMTGVDVLQNYGAAKVNEGSQRENYGTEPGFQMGIHLAFPLMNRNIRFMSGLSFVSRNYKYQEQLITSTERNALNFATLTTRETQNLFQVPLLLSIDFDQWNAPNYRKNIWVPFIYGGISVDYMFAARMSEISRINLVGASESGLSNPQIGNLRRNINYSLILGGGMKFKFGSVHIYLNARYTQGINNVIEPSERYSNEELLYVFGYVDDDFRLRSFSVSLGLEKAFYNAKKLKK